MNGYFAQVRRAGFDLGLSAGRLTKVVEVLSQLPPGVTASKEVVVQHLGMLGQMSKTRDVNALEQRQAPGRAGAPRQVLPRRQGLAFGIGHERSPQEKLSTVGHRKLAALAAKEGMTPDELLGRLISSWRCDNWRDDFNADAKACEILVDAMARFMMHLKARGTSPRSMSGVRGELNAAGFLVMCCDAPKGESVLRAIDGGPSQYEHRRKFSGSPRAWVRFLSTWEAFSTFLRDSGLVESRGEESR